MSLLIASVGLKGTGKTTGSIQLIKSFPLRHIFVNDVQHDPLYKCEKTISKFHGSSQDYMKLINKYAHKNSKCGFILEEAANFLPHANRLEVIINALLSARHHANVYVCNFHALQQIPEYIMFYLDYLWIRKSAGQPAAIHKKFANYPQVIDAWYKATASNDKYYNQLVALNKA